MAVCPPNPLSASANKRSLKPDHAEQSPDVSPFALPQLRADTQATRMCFIAADSMPKDQLMQNNDARYLLDVSRLVWRRWSGTRPTGIDRICLAWLGHFAWQSQAALFHKRGWHILPVKASKRLFHLLESDGDRQTFRTQFTRWAARNLLQIANPLPGRGRLWLNVGHTGLNLPQLVDWVGTADIRPVVMLHDIIPISHPHFCRDGEKARHETRVKTMLRIAHAVIGNSQDTLDRLHNFARGVGMAVPQALAVWPGTPCMTLPPAQRRPLSDEFIVLGTIEGRKNHMLLLNVWDRLVREEGRKAPKLVIIGRRGWACDDVLARLAAGGFGDRVLETGALDDADTALRMAGATALLFPSHAEGYGLPLVEALDAGLPVIASQLDVFREIGQGIPDLLPPDDLGAWTQVVRAYAAPNSPARAAQMARLAGFRVPDWQGHFAKVERFLGTIDGDSVVEPQVHGV